MKSAKELAGGGEEQRWQFVVGKFKFLGSLAKMRVFLLWSSSTPTQSIFHLSMVCLTWDGDRDWICLSFSDIWGKPLYPGGNFALFPNVFPTVTSAHKCTWKQWLFLHTYINLYYLYYEPILTRALKIPWRLNAARAIAAWLNFTEHTSNFFYFEKAFVSLAFERALIQLDDWSLLHPLLLYQKTWSNNFWII